MEFVLQPGCFRLSIKISTVFFVFLFAIWLWFVYLTVHRQQCLTSAVEEIKNEYLDLLQQWSDWVKEALSKVIGLVVLRKAYHFLSTLSWGYR